VVTGVQRPLQQYFSDSKGQFNWRISHYPVKTSDLPKFCIEYTSL